MRGGTTSPYMYAGRHYESWCVCETRVSVNLRLWIDVADLVPHGDMRVVVRVTPIAL